MRRRMAVLALLALSAGCVSACSGGDDPSALSTRVDPVQATTLHTRGVTLRIPPGSASGGTVTLTATTPPDEVPRGLDPLGPAAAVLLAGGALAAPATLSFTVPAGLRRGDVPVVVWRTGTGWTWLPTSWRSGQRTVDVHFTRPSTGYLAKVDLDSWVEGLRKGFVERVTSAADVSPPYCAGQADAANAGLASGSDPGAQVRWCMGVEGGRPVMRVTNETQLASEVTFPEDWPVAAGQGAVGAAVRSALGFGAPPPVGRAARYLGGGETLTLHPPPDGRGVVTAEVTPTAWLVSSLLAVSDAYAAVVTESDRALGRAATAAAHALPGDLARGLPPGASGASAMGSLHDCLGAAPETDPSGTLDPPAAEQLLRQAVHCAPRYFARALAAAHASPAGRRLADHVGRRVLDGLLQELTASADDWNAYPGTTRASAYRIWVGPPPPQELDYEAAPMTFTVGSKVDVAAWTPEFRAYVRERLDYLVTSADTGSGCAEGSFTVRRYRSDGFALAGQVGCDGVPHQLVLGRLSDGWHEIDDTEATADDPDAFFSCDLLRLYSVPAFIAGDRCASGAEVQDYP